MKCILGVLIFLTCIFNVSIEASACDNKCLFEGKTVLVLGGTGYLGRAIVEEVSKYSPKAIIVFSRDEVKHFHMQDHFKNPAIHYVIGDVRDYASLLKVTRGVDIVFHVAALKRMDALEDNAEEAVKTNLLGSINVFNACVANNVKKVLFVSTDKACLPVNIYGASKFSAEKIFTNYDRSSIPTVFVAVRFGNILESTGSVIPIFLEKIKHGQALTLTDARMTRFIIDKKAAVDLMFDALRYAVGGELFVRRLYAMRIVDLIDVLKSGLGADTQTKVIGLRPGEKLHEVLINSPEMARAVEFNGYFIVQPSVSHAAATLDQKPLYLQYGSPVKAKFNNEEYSSDQAVISKDELSAYFRRISIL